MGNRLGDEIHAIAIDVSSLTLNLESEISGRIRYEYPSLFIMYKAPFDTILIKSSCWVRHIRMCFLRNNSIWHAPLISHCWGIILVSSSNSYYSYVNFPITENYRSSIWFILSTSYSIHFTCGIPPTIEASLPHCFILMLFSWLWEFAKDLFGDNLGFLRSILVNSFSAGKS